MFCEETFIAECNTFLRSNTYEDYEDVRNDIELFVEDNLPSNQANSFQYLCVRILQEYIENPPPIAEVDDYDDGNILFQAVEIWLAQGEKYRVSAG
jgi:hypothetical protein